MILTLAGQSSKCEDHFFNSKIMSFGNNMFALHKSQSISGTVWLICSLSKNMAALSSFRGNLNMAALGRGYDVN